MESALQVKALFQFIVREYGSECKRKAAIGPLLEAFKSGLKHSMKDAKILEEGRLKDSNNRNGYIICSFTDRRGMKHVQLVQYYVSGDRLLQMIISDRPEGFRNLEKVIRRIHRSLKVLKPSLK